MGFAQTRNDHHKDQAMAKGADDPIMTFRQAMEAIGMTPYREQTTMARHVARVEEKGAIGFVEAPTATGKTLVCAHRAIDTAMKAATPYVIAVPTIEIAHQTLGAINRIRQANEVYRGCVARMVLGRNEFVSAAALSSYAEDLDRTIADVVAHWLEAGAPGIQDGHPTHTMRGLEHALDLAGVRLEVPSSIALGPGETDTDSGLAYSAQFDEGADVLVVTHAMLARDLLTRYVALNRERRALGMTLDAETDPRKRWLLANDQRLEIETGDEGRLPDHRRLIVDEAHLLRQNVESALTTGIALNPLVRHLEALRAGSKGVVDDATIARVRRLRRTLTEHPLRTPGGSVVVNWIEHHGIGDIVEQLADALAQVKTGKATGMEADAAAVDRARYALQESARAKGVVRTVVEWSPVISFPTISVGRDFLGGEFRLLWERLASATLVSATLYTENVTGPSMKHSAARLFVPDQRQMSFAPIKADWLVDPVTVWLPDEESAETLTPEDGEGRDGWLDALAGNIVPTESFCNGTLVLSTSRATSREVARRVADELGADRVIDGSDLRLSAGRARFIAAARAGMRPIWFAQGPAWTGLDLPDDVLDTLFVTRLPYPKPDADDTSGRSTGTYGDKQISTMMMTLKQGVGRLVRVRDAGEKKAIVLDGRVMTSRSAKGALTLLRQYRTEAF
jgi:CRISPR type IV-associated DEAD/DEAH-box helicase Csf4